MSDLTQSLLKEVLHYDPETGAFTRRACRRSTQVGSPAGSIHIWRGKVAAVRMSILGKMYQAHRLAWLYMTGEWPSEFVDHIDMDPTNNRWANLRLATNAQNGWNRGIQKNNKVGLKGVSKQPSGKYVARIWVNRKMEWLGTFDTAEEAHAAYVAAASRHHGSFACLHAPAIAAARAEGGE